MKNTTLLTLVFCALPILGNADTSFLNEMKVKKKSKENSFYNSKEKRIQESSSSFHSLTRLVDQYAEHTLKKGNIQSLALAIYKDGAVYQQYYGMLDSQSQQKPNDHTLYEIASISKIFAGTLAARAVLDHKINLEDDVRLYLQGDYSNLQFDGTPIRIQDLLTHTLGLEHKNLEQFDRVFKQIRAGYYENRAFDYTMADLLEELKTAKVTKKPGTVYEYSSVGPELMAYVLEQVYHKPYSELLRDFLADANMKQTYLNEYELHKNQLAISYDENGHVAPLLKNPLLGGAFGMSSTLPDLVQFMRFQLESKDPAIQESTRLLFKEEEDGDDKGYLWDVGYGQKEGNYYGKTGTSNGVQSGILLCPDSTYGMILIVNNTSDVAQSDWGNLYDKIETALIQYPKINLVALLASDFQENFDLATTTYIKLKEDSEHYLAGSFYLNNYAYELASEQEFDQAIRLLEFALTLGEDQANLYDSLGEIYAMNGQYGQALVNYKHAVTLNPNNENAKQFIEQMQSTIQVDTRKDN